MFRLLCVIFLLATSSCGHDKEPTETVDNRKADAEQLYQRLLLEARALQDPVDGWINRGCDGMIWSGKFASVTGAKGVNILAAEFPEEPGRFGRRPEPRCWTPTGGDSGSKTTWSRDMAVAGFFPWAWRARQLEPLVRHERYGKANTWKMGEPLSDGRTIYSPSLIGLFYQLLHKMGGPTNILRKTPQLYPAGLTDFPAHLQVMNIWLFGEMNAKISGIMHGRLVEHAEREPKCWTYQAMRGIYDGMEPALDLALSGEWDCSYARCEDGKSCVLAEKIWGLDLILRNLGG